MTAPHLFCRLSVLALVGWALAFAGPGCSQVLADEQAVPLPATSDVPEAIVSALDRAGANRAEILAAWNQAPAEQRGGLEFLLQHMPTRDLNSLSAEFILENVSYAYRAWNEAPWHDQVSAELFYNDVLPYANINERRDRWRKDFYERFQPLVVDAKSPGEAAAKLNQQIFNIVKVHYSTKRPKADQSPYESIDAGMASCTGLSILLIDACRAVGVPARFVGIPMWTDGSGNHSWVEVWDNGWHFTGADEATGSDLDKGWFVDRAVTSSARSATTFYLCGELSTHAHSFSFGLEARQRLRTRRERYRALSQQRPINSSEPCGRHVPRLARPDKRPLRRKLPHPRCCGQRRLSRSDQRRTL